MKKLFAIIAFAALLFAVTDAQAQYAAQTLGVHSVVTGTSNYTTQAVMDVRKQKDVCLSFVVGGSTNCVITVQQSVDGSAYATLKAIQCDNTTVVTNLTVGGAGYLRISSIANTGTIPATNTFKYSIKLNAP